MSYSIETYDKAQNILDRRKEKATLEAQSRIDKLCAEIPELNVINRKLAQIGLNISRTFFTSKDPQADINKLRIESLALQEEKKNLLKKNGYDENELAIKYTCTACEDTGFINGRRCKCFVNLLKEIERDKIEKSHRLKNAHLTPFPLNTTLTLPKTAAYHQNTEQKKSKKAA